MKRNSPIFWILKWAALVVACFSLACASTGAAGKTKQQVQAPKYERLSPREAKEAVKNLPPKYKEWLELHEPIMTKEEVDLFLRCKYDFDRESFIRRFWSRRSFDKYGSPTNYQERYEERATAAKEYFGNLKSDPARVFLAIGPPDEILKVNCQDVYVPLEIWKYSRRVEELHASGVELIFYCSGMGFPCRRGQMKLWLPSNGRQSLMAAPFSEGGIEALRRGTVSARQECDDYYEVERAMATSAEALGQFGEQIEKALFLKPYISAEEIRHELDIGMDPSPLAKKIAIVKVMPVALAPSYSPSMLNADVSLLLRKSDLIAREIGDARSYNLNVNAQIAKVEGYVDAKGEKRLEVVADYGVTRYRFDFSEKDLPDELPITVRFKLFHGNYLVRLKVTDANRYGSASKDTAEAYWEGMLDVPPPETLAAKTQAGAAAGTAIPPAAPVSAADTNRQEEQTAKREDALPPVILLPLTSEPAIGLQKVRVRAAENVKAVEFFLDGKKLLKRNGEPFETDFDFGSVPIKHTIRAVGYGPRGETIYEDSLAVNNPYALEASVRIVSPMRGARVKGQVKVLAIVNVKGASPLDKVEFYHEDKLVGLPLREPPFSRVVDIASSAITYVTVVATLKDGTVVDDTRYLNAPPSLIEVEVNAVELYATVLDENNHPRRGLTRENFSVFEDGKKQNIVDFKYAKNLPLTVGLAIDTSYSMTSSFAETIAAAMEFLKETVRDSDKFFITGFNNKVYYVVRPTGDKEKVAAALLRLRVEGETALYDAIIGGFYQLSGIKGRKALVVLTDGDDTASRFDAKNVSLGGIDTTTKDGQTKAGEKLGAHAFKIALEYAKRANSSLYVIGMGIPEDSKEIRERLRELTSATGGRTYYVSDSKDLPRAYQEINEEMRSQYLLTYYADPAKPIGKWRKVKVDVLAPDVKVRTIPGYFP